MSDNLYLEVRGVEVEVVILNEKDVFLGVCVVGEWIRTGDYPVAIRLFMSPIHRRES